jgi:rfaE bifunctional protein nucleotidyltransferase chain/domain
MGHVWTLDEAVKFRQLCRQAGRPLIFTNGHFDLLHVGHLDYLQRARVQGGSDGGLIVGINGDESTRQLKGAGRPLVPAVERAQLIAALDCVSGAVIFEANTATELISALQPDWYVKGGDYANKTWPERDLAVACGGQVALIPFMPDHSTSALIARIRALPDNAGAFRD